MPTIISNVLLHKLASFPNESEGVAGVNVVPRGSAYEVNRPIRVLF